MFVSMYLKFSPRFSSFFQFDEGKNVFDGEFSVADLTSFVRTNSLPLVVEFSDEVSVWIKGF